MSDFQNRRWPPIVTMKSNLPDEAHRATVFGLTRNSVATSPGVSSTSFNEGEKLVIVLSLHVGRRRWALAQPVTSVLGPSRIPLAPRGP